MIARVLPCTDNYADFLYGPNRERVRSTEHQGTTATITLELGLLTSTQN